MSHRERQNERTSMFGLGHKCAVPRADVDAKVEHVRCGGKADVPDVSRSCPLMTYKGIRQRPCGQETQQLPHRGHLSGVRPKVSGVHEWRLHDLRRTCVSGMARENAYE